MDLSSSHSSRYSSTRSRCCHSSSFSRNSNQQNHKHQLLEMVDIIQQSLEKSWTISSRKKKAKLQELDKVRQKIMDIDDSKMSIVLDNNYSIASRCLPGFRKGSGSHREMEKQLSKTLEFLDEQTSSIRSDAAVYDPFEVESEESEESKCEKDVDTTVDMDESFSVGSSESNYKDNEEDGQIYMNLDANDKDPNSSDILVTTSTSRLQDDKADSLGISITTWQSYNLKEKAIPMSASGRQDSVGTVSTASSSLHAEMEEISVSFGNKVVVRASRSSKVRFIGVKPTTQDNISRARELLQNARRLKGKM